MRSFSLLLLTTVGMLGQSITQPGGASPAGCPGAGSVELYGTSSTFTCDSLAATVLPNQHRMVSGISANYTGFSGNAGPTAAITGTTTANMATTSLTGVGTKFLAEVHPGDCLIVSSAPMGGGSLVVDVPNDTTVTLIEGWCGGSTLGDGTLQTMSVQVSPFSITYGISTSGKPGYSVFTDPFMYTWERAINSSAPAVRVLVEDNEWFTQYVDNDFNEIMREEWSYSAGWYVNSTLNLRLVGNGSIVEFTGTGGTLYLTPSVAISPTATAFLSGTDLLLQDSNQSEQIELSTSGVSIKGIILANSLQFTGSATGKNVVCVDTTTGQLYASSSGVACAN